MTAVAVTVTQEGVPVMVGVTYLSFISSIPPDVALGAFAGSVIFLLGVNNKPKWQWSLYFMIAFLAGILGAAPVASVSEALLAFLHINVELSQGIGAMMSAACTINVISWFRDNATVLLDRKKGENA